MADVVKFTGITTVPEPPEQVLEKAKDWGLKRVLVIGADKDGNLKWGGSISDVEAINLLLDAAKHELITDAFG